MEQTQIREQENRGTVDLSGSVANIMNSYLRILSSHYPTDAGTTSNSASLTGSSSDPASTSTGSTPQQRERRPIILVDSSLPSQRSIPAVVPPPSRPQTTRQSRFSNANYTNDSFPGTANYLEDTDVNGHVRRQHQLLQETIVKYNTITANFEEFLINNIGTLQPMQINTLIENMNHYHENMAKLFDVLKMAQESINTIVYVSKMTRFLETIHQINNLTPSNSSPATVSPSTTNTPSLNGPSSREPSTIQPTERTNTNRSRLYQRFFYLNNADDATNIRTNRNTTGLSVQEITEKIEYISYNNDANTEEDRCPISLEDFVENEIICKIKGCRHCFKITPLMNWLSINTYCPVCRYNLKTYLNENINIDVDAEQTTNSVQNENTADNVDSSVMDILEMSIETLMNTFSNDLSGNEIAVSAFLGIV